MTQLPTAVIVDMDSTTVDVSSLLHHVINRPKNYHAFHTESINCPPHPMGVAFIENAVRDGHRILIVTGRHEQYRELTVEWIDTNLPDDTPIEGVWMRGDNDRRSAVEVKKAIYLTLSEDYDIVGAIDDDTRIVDLWTSLGVANVVAVPRSPLDTSER